MTDINGYPGAVFPTLSADTFTGEKAEEWLGLAYLRCTERHEASDRETQKDAERRGMGSMDAQVALDTSTRMWIVYPPCNVESQLSVPFALPLHERTVSHGVL